MTRFPRFLKRRRSIGKLILIAGLPVFLALQAGETEASVGSILSHIPNPTPGFDEGFGLSIAVQGNQVWIGSPWDSNGTDSAGRVYVHDLLTLSREFVLENPAPAAGDEFGYSLSPLGQDILVGAPGDGDETGVQGAGVVYLLDGDSASVLLTIPNPAPTRRAKFGKSVASAGTVIAVGGTGTVYLFDGSFSSAGFGSLMGTIENPNPALIGQFGRSLSGNGELLLVGSNSPGSGGQVYVYRVDPNGGGFGEAVLVLDNPDSFSGSGFGTTVGWKDNFILVSATRDTIGAQGAGVVYVFEGDRNHAAFGDRVLTLESHIPQKGDRFGHALGGAGKYILVGAPDYSRIGAIFLFDGDPVSAGFGSLISPIPNPSSSVDSDFGWTVGGSRERVWVGAPGENSGQPYAGAVYVFEGDPPPLGTPTLTPTPTNTAPPVPTNTFTQTPTPTSITQGENTHWVSSIGGSIQAVAVEGDYAYIGEGFQFTVLDISDPALPSVVVRKPFGGTILSIKLVGSIAYIGGDEGVFSIYDVSDPSDPVQLSWSDRLQLSRVEDIDIQGSIAYLAAGAGGAGLRILDVSDPTRPVPLGYHLPIDEEDGDLEAVYDLQVFEGVAYISAGRQALQLVDVSDPTQPTLLKDYRSELGVFVSAVRIADSKAYIATQTDLLVFDTSTPASPELIATVPTEANIEDLVVDGTRVYALYWGIGDYTGFQVFEISDPANPVPSPLYEFEYQSYKLAAQEGQVFVAGTRTGLLAYDATDPDNAFELGGYSPPIRAHCVDAVGSFAAVGGGVDGERHTFHMVDASDPAVPQVISNYKTSHSVADVIFDGTLAFLGGNGVEVLDLSDPTDPVSLAKIDGLGLVRSLKVVDTILYAVAYQGGMSILDIQDPTSPQVLLARHDGQGSQWFDLAVDGSYAYLVKSGGFFVYNVQTSSSPLFVSSLPLDFGPTLPYTLMKIEIKGEKAIIAGGSRNGVVVIDLSDPANPKLDLDYFVNGDKTDLEIEGGIGFFAAGRDGGLQILDLFDPLQPAFLGSFVSTGLKSAGETVGVDVEGDDIYLAESVGGLSIVRYDGCIHSATISFSCEGEIQPSTGELKLQFFAGAPPVTACSGIVPPTEAVLADFHIDCAPFVGPTGPSCHEIAKVLGDRLATSIEADAGHYMTWRPVTDGTLLIRSVRPFTVSLCGEEIGLPCEEGLVRSLHNCAVSNLCDGTSGNESAEVHSQGIGLEVLTGFCPTPIPTATFTPSATFSPSATPAASMTPTPTETPSGPTPTPPDPSDLALDGSVNSLDLFRMIQHLQRRVETHKYDPIFRFSNDWGKNLENR